MAVELVRRLATSTSGGELDITNPQTIVGDKILTGTNNYVPAGVIFDYAGVAPPSAWLFCDGAAISRTTYAGLFAAISTTYGIGDNSTTFNLPDFRGRFARYNDNMGTGAAGRDTGRVHGSVQTQTTAKNGLSASLSGSNSASGISGSAAAHTVDYNHSHSTQIVHTASNTGNVSSVSAGNGSGSPHSYGSNIDFMSVNVPALSVSGSAGAQAWSGSATVSGDTETRPINLSCNKIIKI